MKKRVPIKGIVIIVALLIFSVSIVKQIQTMRKINNETSTKTEELEKMKETNQRLHTELERAQSNSSYLEKMARERLGMIKGGEKVIVSSGAGQ